MRASQSTLGHQGHPSHGGVFVLRGERLSAEDRTLLLTAARAVLLSRHGRLADQVIRLERPPTDDTAAPACRRAGARHHPSATTNVIRRCRNSSSSTDWAGSTRTGVSTSSSLGPGQSTPAPWLNVIANSSFGFQVSESGAGYTWAGNSRENQLTPWSNDPVSDPPVEALYVRDDDSGELWSPTAQPIRCAESTYVARHGAGYSRFEHFHSGVQLDLVQFVQPDAPVKLSVLTVENRVRATSAPVGHRIRRVGARNVAWRQRTMDHHRIRTGDAGVAGDEPVECRVRRTCRLPRHGWAADGMDRRPHRVPRPQRRARAAGGTRPRAPTPTGGRGRAGSVRRVADEHHAGGRREHGDRRRARTGRHARGRNRSHPATPAARTTPRRWRRSGERGTTSRQRSRFEHRTARWTSCSTAGSCTRPSPAGSGRGRRSTRRAARTDSATSSRT